MPCQQRRTVINAIATVQVRGARKASIAISINRARRVPNAQARPSVRSIAQEELMDLLNEAQDTLAAELGSLRRSIVTARLNLWSRRAMRVDGANAQMLLLA